MSTNAPLIQSIQSCVLPHHQSVTVALSGGVDSIVMLHACLSLRDQSASNVNINAVHIHHGLSPNADAWLAFCQSLCQQHDVPFLYKKVRVQPKPRESLEAVARHARYTAIDELVELNSLVLLAQHEDDQAETVLLQLKRGAGPKGLSGMASAFQKSSHVEYARPWINAGIGKQEILEYAKQHQLQWVEDESNNDTAFERNFIRNDIMPLLKEKWPQISKTISRSAKLCASQNQVIEHLANETLLKNQNADGALSIQGLLALPEALSAEVLRQWSAGMIGFNVSAAQLQEVQKLAAAREDQVGFVQAAEWQCRRFNHSLYWVPLADVIKTPLSGFDLAINLTIDLTSNLAKQSEVDDGIKDNTVNFCITYGELHRKVKLFANRPSKTIKAWMKENKIKPWRRLATPIICYSGQIFGVYLDDELIVCEHFQEQSSRTSSDNKDQNLNQDQGQNKNASNNNSSVGLASFDAEDLPKIVRKLKDAIN